MHKRRRGVGSLVLMIVVAAALAGVAFHGARPAFAAITGTGDTVFLTEGIAFSYPGEVATFTDGDPNCANDKFTVTINWGDGNTSPADGGTVGGTFNCPTLHIFGTHTYAEDGQYTITVTLTDITNPDIGIAMGTANVQEGSFILSGVRPITVAEGTSFSGTLATFSDPGSPDQASAFTATIDWGDGAITTATAANGGITGTGGGNFTVTGMHTYQDELSGGSINVTVHEPALNFSLGPNPDAVTVTEGDVLSTGGTVSLTAPEGAAAPYNFTFTDTNTAATGADFTATIAWGDGTTTHPTVTGGSGLLTISTTHDYADEGTDTAVVTIAEDPPGTAGGSGTATVTVTESDTLSGTGTTFTAQSGQSTGTIPVATFTDSGYPGNVPGDFTATIDWGDGTGTQPGTVSGGSGSFTVSGAHTYASPGTRTVTVKLMEDPQGTATAMATSTANVSSADLAVTKTGPATATAGQSAPLSYLITLTNNGPSDAQSVTLTDPLPAGTTFFSLAQGSGPTFTCTTPAFGAGGTVSCTIGTFANGATTTFSLLVQLAASASSGTLSNTATASSTTPDPTPANNSGTANTTVAGSADLAVTKTGPAQVNAGQSISYAIGIANHGPSDAQGVTLTDTLPAGETFTSLTQNSGPAFSCATPAVGAGGTVNCTLATLANGAAATFTLVATVSAAAVNGSSISNTATASATTADPNGGNNSATATTTVAVASVTSCSVSPTLLTPTDGMLHQVTITISATGPFTLQSVTANQPITASDYTFVPGTSYPANTTTITGSLKAAVTAGSHGRIYALKFVASGPAAGSSCEVTVQVKAR